MLSRRAPASIFATLALFFVLATNGRVLSPDAVLRARAAEGLLHRGDPAVDAPGIPPGFLVPGRDGRMMPKYEAGPSLVALPLVAVGDLLARVAPAGAERIFRGPLFLWYSPDDAATAWRFAAIGLTNAGVVALTCALLYALARGLAVAPRAAAWTAAAAALASPLWVYSRDLFAEPLAALGLVVCALAVERLAETSRSSTAALAGLGLGLSVLARFAHLALLPLAALLFAHALRAVPRARWRAVSLAALGGLAAMLAVVAGWNWLRFGALTATGYGPEMGQWTTPPSVGLRGLLLSPGRGLLWHAPLVVLALASTPAAWRRSPRAVLWAWGTLAILLAVYCRWYGWDGGWCWGPRFLVPAIPALVLLCAPFFDRERIAMPRAAGYAVVLLAVGVTFSGTLVAYTDFDQALRRAGGAVPYLETVRWSWRAFPPVAYWGFRPKVFYLAPALLTTPAAWPLAALFGAGVALLVPSARRTWRLACGEAEPAPARLRWRTALAILAVAALCAGLALRGTG